MAGRHRRPRSGVRRTVVTTGLVGGMLSTGLIGGLVPMASASTTASVGTPLLRVGSRGSAVADLQARLGVAADGAFGPQTQAAVINFQRGHGLAADGVVGPRTWIALGAGGGAAATPAVVAAPASFSSASGGVVAVAASLAGRPYRYGAAGPASFDCSGLVQYAYARVGVSLPRTTEAQYAATRHIPTSAMRPGDLIFVVSGGTVSHVGIYAGDNSWWVARHTGTTVTRQQLYTSSIVAGRV
jgi:cell wall-associated NlpC family hydrolase